MQIFRFFFCFHLKGFLFQFLTNFFFCLSAWNSSFHWFDKHPVLMLVLFISFLSSLHSFRTYSNITVCHRRNKFYWSWAQRLRVHIKQCYIWKWIFSQWEWSSIEIKKGFQMKFFFLISCCERIQKKIFPRTNASMWPNTHTHKHTKETMREKKQPNVHKYLSV